MEQSASARSGGVSAADFVFDGPLGSEGARVTPVGPRHFRIALGHAPGHPEWPNKLNFQIARHARGEALTIEVSFDGGRGMSFNEYPQAWSYDDEHWTPVMWERGFRASPQADVLRLPRLERDRVYVGTQTPLSYEQLMQKVGKWAEHSAVSVHRLGASMQGRELVRLEVADPATPNARGRRRAHYISMQHPGEFNAQWRIVGMIEWLLGDSPAAVEARQKQVFHFVPTMSPDGPRHGWYRVNQAGHDMNRTYLASGSDPDRQTHEAYICQRDFEKLMASDTPICTAWSMHTWQGIVEPILLPGPEFRGGASRFDRFKALMQQQDDEKLIKPMQLREALGEPGTGSWSGGPWSQFGLTCVLCEGGSHFDLQQNLRSGQVLARSICAYYAELE